LIFIYTFCIDEKDRILAHEVDYNSSESSYSFILKNLTHFTTYEVSVQVCREGIEKEPKMVCSDNVAEDRIQTPALSKCPTQSCSDVP